MCITAENFKSTIQIFWPYFFSAKQSMAVFCIDINVISFSVQILLFYRVPKGLEDVSKYPSLFAELVRRNWTEEDLGKLAGQNIIKVLKRAEEVCIIY